MTGDEGQPGIRASYEAVSRSERPDGEEAGKLKNQSEKEEPAHGKP